MRLFMIDCKVLMICRAVVIDAISARLGRLNTSV